MTHNRAAARRGLAVVVLSISMVLITPGIARAQCLLGVAGSSTTAGQGNFSAVSSAVSDAVSTVAGWFSRKSPIAVGSDSAYGLTMTVSLTGNTSADEVSATFSGFVTPDRHITSISYWLVPPGDGHPRDSGERAFTNSDSLGRRGNAVQVLAFLSYEYPNLVEKPDDHIVLRVNLPELKADGATATVASARP